MEVTSSYINLYLKRNRNIKKIEQTSYLIIIQCISNFFKGETGFSFHNLHNYVHRDRKKYDLKIEEFIKTHGELSF